LGESDQAGTPSAGLHPLHPLHPLHAVLFTGEVRLRSLCDAVLVQEIMILIMILNSPQRLAQIYQVRLQALPTSRDDLCLPSNNTPLLTLHEVPPFGDVAWACTTLRLMDPGLRPEGCGPGAHRRGAQRRGA
jgi:hypothetical protein